MKALPRSRERAPHSSTKGFRAMLPEGLEIGQRFLLSFEDPAVGACQGRLQEMSSDGSLCVDAPSDLRPPRGTPVRVRSLRIDSPAYTFASEIRGRGRLKKSQVPVLLLAPPTALEPLAQRSAHRVTVCLRGLLEWRHPAATRAADSCPAVLTNLSGGGAQIFVRQRPASEFVRLSVDLPTSFVNEVARRQWRREGIAPRNLAAAGDSLHAAGERTSDRYRGIEAHIASSHLHLQDDRGAIYAVSLAFAQPQEGCYQLVRYLERQAARRGIHAAAESGEPGGHRRSGAPCESVLVASAA